MRPAAAARVVKSYSRFATPSGCALFECQSRQQLSDTKTNFSRTRHNGGMRVIGMLGGMSWESTAVYYRLPNEPVRERLGGMHSGRIVLDSVDFADIEALQVSAQWEAAGRVLAARARALELAGADCLLICTNTMHLVVDQIETATSIPVLHIADTTAAAARAARGTPRGLLGTPFTMEQELCF